MTQNERFTAFMIIFILALLACAVICAGYEDYKLGGRIELLETATAPTMEPLDVTGWISGCPTPCPCCEEANP